MSFSSLISNALIIVIVFYSIIIHEVSHAFAAYALGDDSAQRAGRLSFNPRKHIDIFGTIILPLLFYFSLGVVWGYAKPVPFNPYNFKNIKRDSGLTALAGPLSNILVAIVFSLIFHLIKLPSIQYIVYFVVFMNLILAFFNLIPFPPLDGSKVVGMFLTDEAFFKWAAFERKGMLYLFIILIASNLLRINIIGKIIFPPVMFMLKILGLPVV
ncbi:MAG: site-2 protease family protein [Candidatus Cloacimonetes bacterium]|nr:site-2 protease family protein [Candidatus Cloacimonadota bacterium]